jgi:undecaprenyl diphosphate synthase
MASPSTGNSQLAHIAIILDGNGRWARARGLARNEGHREGGRALHRLLDAFLAKEIPCVSLYAFSTENWKRPAAEVEFLWNLMADFFERHIEECLSKGIRIVSSGDLTGLPPLNRKILERCMKLTESCTALTANFCLNYGAKQEIARAAHRIVLERLALCQSGHVQEAAMPVTAEEIESHLYTAGLPPVDLLIRPGGECRISNFLLWQIAYAELYFTEVFWPDFSTEDLEKALAWFQGRQRRYGGLIEE